MKEIKFDPPIKLKTNTLYKFNMKKTNFQQYFEANLLDGDDINDCGKAMLDAKDVFEVMEEYHLKALTKQKQEIIKEINNSPYSQAPIDIENNKWISCPSCGSKSFICKKCLIEKTNYIK